MGVHILLSAHNCFQGPTVSSVLESTCFQALPEEDSAAGHFSRTYYLLLSLLACALILLVSMALFICYRYGLFSSLAPPSAAHSSASSIHSDHDAILLHDVLTSEDEEDVHTLGQHAQGEEEEEEEEADGVDLVDNNRYDAEQGACSEDV
jgi:hypothetical protein